MSRAAKMRCRADPLRVEQALERACMGSEAHRLQDGLDTVVGERGLTLSGGQRQRVQLARAFYRSYRLLVLDDVLSAVDQETEAQLCIGHPIGVAPRAGA